MGIESIKSNTVPLLDGETYHYKGYQLFSPGYNPLATIPKELIPGPPGHTDFLVLEYRLLLRPGLPMESVMYSHAAFSLTRQGTTKNLLIDRSRNTTLERRADPNDPSIVDYPVRIKEMNPGSTDAVAYFIAAIENLDELYDYALSCITPKTGPEAEAMPLFNRETQSCHMMSLQIASRAEIVGSEQNPDFSVRWKDNYSLNQTYHEYNRITALGSGQSDSWCYYSPDDPATRNYVAIFNGYIEAENRTYYRDRGEPPLKGLPGVDPVPFPPNLD